MILRSNRFTAPVFDWRRGPLHAQLDPSGGPLFLLKPARLLAAIVLASGLITAAVSTPASATSCPSPTVTVSTAAGLHTALAAAAPGDSIALDPGTYTGLFVTSVDGTSSAPVWLCGPSTAVLDGGSITGGYGLHLNGASWWHVQGFSVTNGQKGVIVDAADHVTVEGLTVHDVGDEAIHLRTNTVDSLVTGNTIYGTGLRRDTFGEAVYVGSSDANWGVLTGGQPDRSDRNVVSYNTIWDVSAEAVDVKEGTTGGQVIGNVMDGELLAHSGITDRFKDADSWVDIKGNDYLISGNTGVHSLLTGYETHRRNMIKKGLGDWGLRNEFTGNSADVQAPVGPDPSRGFFIHDPSTSANIVRCNNVVSNAATFASYGVTCVP